MTYHAFRQRGSYGSRIPGLIDPKAMQGFWWLPGTANDAHVDAAYQSIKVPSYTDSKTNLVNAGAYDLTDPATPPSWTVGSGWDFNGLDDYLTIGNGGITTKPVTIIARIEPAGSGNRNICSNTASGALQFQLSGILYLIKSGDAVIGSSSTTLSNVDMVVAVTYDVSGNYAFYIDGVADGSGTNNQTFSRTNNCIGRNYDGKYFNGYIKGISYYSVALSQAEVQTVSDKLASI